MALFARLIPVSATVLPPAVSEKDVIALPLVLVNSASATVRLFPGTGIVKLVLETLVFVTVTGSTSCQYGTLIARNVIV